jgi:two-component system, LytTR family, response regulator LytT
VRALIADDEALARDEMAYMLQRVGGIDTIDQAANALEALARLQEARYDVLFLDIRMPGLTGLEAMELVNRLPGRPHVVFVTAYDEHALAAFEVAANDYLLKPVSEARLRRALDRITRAGSGSQLPGPTAQQQQRFGGKLAVEGEDHTILLRVSDVRFVHARRHTVLVSTFDAEHRCRSSLAELDEQLAPQGFLRVHRAYLVNLEHVLEVHPFFAGAYLLRMDDKARTQVPVSRGSAKQVREALGL